MIKSKMLAAVYAEWDEEKGKWIATARHDCYENDECTHAIRKTYEMEICDDTVAFTALMSLCGYESCDLSLLEPGAMIEIENPVEEE